MGSTNASVSGQAERSDEAASDGRQPIGAYLKRQRELRGITAEELARETRIPLRSLERLESGTFDGQVDGFVRGFVRTVASALGLDPNETVARMLAEPATSEGGALGRRRFARWPRALFGIGIALVLALAVGLVRIAATGGGADDGDANSEIIVRVDPVRALAEAQAGVAASAPRPVAAPPPAAPSDATR